ASVVPEEPLRPEFLFNRLRRLLRLIRNEHTSAVFHGLQDRINDLASLLIVAGSESGNPNRLTQPITKPQRFFTQSPSDLAINFLMTFPEWRAGKGFEKPATHQNGDHVGKVEAHQLTEWSHLPSLLIPGDCHIFQRKSGNLKDGNVPLNRS